ncbi:MAG: hypothetical protein ACKVOL_06010 [Novosphingobium sp.]
MPTEPSDEAVQRFDPHDRCGTISLITALASVLYSVFRPFETLDELVSLAVVFSFISIINGKSVVPRVALGILISQFLLVKLLPLLG